MSASSLERDGERLILRTSRSQFLFWFGAFFAGGALFWTVGWFAKVSPGDPNYWVGLTGITFLFAGVFMMLPHEFVTMFDLQTRRVDLDFTLANGYYRSSSSTPLSDIVSLRMYRGDSYSPVLRVRGGREYRLVIWSLEHNEYEKFRDEIAAPICKATGIAYEEANG